MKSNPKFPNQSQIEAITNAVIAAEKRTAGEIVPVILGQSDDYPAARWRMAIAVGLTAAFLLSGLRPHWHPIWIAWLEIPALLVGYVLGSIGALQRTFLAPTEMDQEVKQRALEIFHLHRVSQTRGRTGVLLLISIFERRVEILTDSGIDTYVSSARWEKVVKTLVGELKVDRPVEGLCGAIAECGVILSEYFPRSAADRNELPDAPVISVR